MPVNQIKGVGGKRQVLTVRLTQIGLEPLTFDVHATASCGTQLVSSLVRRTLFKVVHGARYRPSDFTLAPDLALTALVSADGRTYTIALRPDVRWESRPPPSGAVRPATAATWPTCRST